MQGQVRTEKSSHWAVEHISDGDTRDDVRSIVGRHNCGWAVDIVRDVRPMTIGSRWIDELCLTKMQFANIRGERGRDLIESDDRAYIGFCFLRDGSATLNGTTSRALSLDRGQILLWSSLRPLEFRVNDHATFFNILIPEENIRVLTGRKLIDPIIISQKSYAAKLAANHMETIMDMVSSGEAFHESYICSATNFIFSNLISGIEYRLHAYGQKNIILMEILTFIDKNIKNPELNPVSISNKFQFSVRYLHKVFEGTGTTVMDYIRCARLNGAQGDLENPLLHHLSITEICFKWGFNDSSHFSRLFHSQFGESARSWRGRKLSSRAISADTAPRAMALSTR